MNETDFDSFIDRLRQGADLVGVISEYIPLKKKGKNYWGCCPFHNEKTPSFSVTPDKGFFYCFGCHAGGNVFNFLMKIENIGFMDAVKLLAQKLNIEMPVQQKSEYEIKKEQEFKKLYKVNELARDFFRSCLLKTQYGEPGRRYLKARGLTDEIIDRFKLGFAPPVWDKLLNSFLNRGFTKEILLKAGLVVASSDEQHVYDRFRNRVMFPICDARGKVVGFGGRVLDDSQPKYLNSPETLLFNKKHILYGLDLAYSSIKEQQQAVIVEGYMDAIAAHAAGVNNVVASMGTAFTTAQARKLLHYTKEIVFAYDSDAAGQQATIRAFNIVQSLATIRVVSIPEGKDPDEFIRKKGADEFKALVKEAALLLDYQIARALKEHDDKTLEGKVAIVTQVIPALAAQENDVQVAVYISRLAQKLAIDERAIRSEYQKYLLKSQKDKNVSDGKNIKSIRRPQNMVSALVRAQQELIYLMNEDNDIIPYVITKLPVEYIKEDSYYEIMKSIYSEYNRNKKVDAAVLTKELNDNAVSVLSYIMSMDFQCADVSRIVDDCIKTIQGAHLNILYEQHRLQADELERMGDSRFLQELAESKRIKDEINKLYQ